MSESSDVLLAKAQECLAGAQSELEAGRYDNAANRAYYACYQAAVAALDAAGIQPSGRTGRWGHDSVQAQFAGQLVNRRKRYAPELRDVLGPMFSIRTQADYRRADVNEKQASRMVARARTFVRSVVAQEMEG